MCALYSPLLPRHSFIPFLFVLSGSPLVVRLHRLGRVVVYVATSCNRQGLLAGEGSWLGLDAGSSRTICVLIPNTISIAPADRTKT